jgi:hypothetical protein
MVLNMEQKQYTRAIKEVKRGRRKSIKLERQRKEKVKRK